MSSVPSPPTASVPSPLTSSPTFELLLAQPLDQPLDTGDAFLAPLEFLAPLAQPRVVRGAWSPAGAPTPRPAPWATLPSSRQFVNE